VDTKAVVDIGEFPVEDTNFEEDLGDKNFEVDMKVAVEKGHVAC